MPGSEQVSPPQGAAKSENFANDLAEIRRRLSLVEDRLALESLASRYGPSVDSLQGAVTANLWTEDGIYDVGAEGTWRGSGIAGLVSDPRHHSAVADGCAHVLTPPHLVIHGDSAEGWSYALHLRHHSETNSFQVIRVSANHWKFERTRSGWRIAVRTNRNLDGSGAARAVFEGIGYPSSDEHEGGHE